MGLWKEFVAACSNKPKKGSSKSNQIQQQPSLEAPTSSTVSSQSSSHASKAQLTQNQAQHPAGVNVEFKSSNGLHHARISSRNSSLGRSASQQAEDRSQAVQEGFLDTTGVYRPSKGFRTPALLQRMVAKYDIPEDEIRKAMEFAESEEYVDVYCFAYCITGGPMETTAFKTAGLEGMDKDAILASAGAPGMDGLKILTPEEQRRHDKARKDFLVEQALQHKDHDAEPQIEDLEDLVEAYRIRFEEDTNDMSLDEVMVYFGVPEASKVAIHKALHPAKGSATAGLDEKARRKAAHSVALERFDELSDA